MERLRETLERAKALELINVRSKYPNGRTWAQVADYLNAPIGVENEDDGGFMRLAIAANYRSMIASTVRIPSGFYED